MTPEQHARYKANLAADPERRAKVMARASAKASQKEREQRRTPRGWIIYNLRTARRRARKAGIEYRLTPDDISIPQVCPVLGIPLLLEGYGQRSSNSPSLDRRDPRKGYVPGNVAVISWLANRLKSNCTSPAVFRCIADYVEGIVRDHRN